MYFKNVTEPIPSKQPVCTWARMHRLTIEGDWLGLRCRLTWLGLPMGLPPLLLHERLICVFVCCVRIHGECVWNAMQAWTKSEWIFQMIYGRWWGREHLVRCTKIISQNYSRFDGFVPRFSKIPFDIQIYTNIMNYLHSCNWMVIITIFIGYSKSYMDIDGEMLLRGIPK